MTNNPKKIYGIEGYGLSVVKKFPSASTGRA
jgi:GTP cyclohydrolase II